MKHANKLIVIVVYQSDHVIPLTNREHHCGCRNSVLSSAFYLLFFIKVFYIIPKSGHCILSSLLALRDVLDFSVSGVCVRR